LPVLAKVGGGKIANMSRIKFIHTYQYIISVENLLLAWKEFLSGKKSRKDVMDFERNLMANIISLHNDLKNKTYKHGEYKAFKINDPKPRDIHKAEVRDRLLHHAIYRILYPYFDKKFIHDSYSCRLEKGTHKAMNRFHKFSQIISQNNTRSCLVLKCDIRKFFASIDHQVLKNILEKYITDKDILWLLNQIIYSFHTKLSARQGLAEKGLPLGNLTSQLLVNIYMNEFDQFMKQELKVEYYVRYADDFVIFSNDKQYPENILPKISEFLENNLKLYLHPNKVSIETIASGVDFLGWIHFPKHRVLRTSTKKRMFRNLE
jgi:retron-type reverse transcriptase